MTTTQVFTRQAQDISAKETLTEISLPITYDIVAGHIAGTRDWFPGHHNPEYAQAQGRENIFANTMFFQGFLDRVALSWLGQGWFVSSRTLTIHKSVYPGHTLVGKGQVTAISVDADGTARVTIDVQGTTDGTDPSISGTVVVTLLPRFRNS